MNVPRTAQLLAIFLPILFACRQEGLQPPPENPGPSANAVIGAAPVLSALLSGRYSSTHNPGNVTRDELAAIAASGNSPAVVQLVTEYDFAPFTPAPVFAGIAGPRGLFEAGGWDSLANFGWQSDRAWPVPLALSGRRVVFNNVAASWGEHGPKWGVRAYNVVGTLFDLELWRVGDWTNGREGHAVYLNVAGDLDVERLRAVECGGQLLQIVWRVGETNMPRTSWPSAANLISIVDCSARDCGAITSGQAVRASWPLSIFATGARVEIDDLRVDCRLPEFAGDRGELFRSHGAVLVSGGEEGRRTPELLIDGLSGTVVHSDRSEVRLAEIDSAELRDLALVEEGGDGACTVDVVDDCRRVHVSSSPAAVVVRIISAAKPFGAPYRTVAVAPGSEFTWP